MSGTNQATTVGANDLLGLVPLVVAVVAILANFQSQEVWAAAVVAILALWAVDLSGQFSARGRGFAALAVATSGAAGALSAHALGGWGYGLAVALAVAICLGWGVAFAGYRAVGAFGPTMLAGLLAALAAASMVLVRSAASPDDQAMTIFLVAITAGVVASSAVSRMSAVPFLDQYWTLALVTVIGAVAGAAIWDADVVGYLLIGLGIAVALIAGSGMATMLRTGQVRLTERAPGMMPSLDGVVLAAAIYYPLVGAIL